jgi:hypothetical protein
MLRFKPEVRIHWFNLELFTILLNASMWSNKTGITVEINSIDDGKHGDPTFHGLSKAADLDTVGDNPGDLESLYQYMRRVMPAGYDVIHEADHIHVECDPKRPESRVKKS